MLNPQRWGATGGTSQGGGSAFPLRMPSWSGNGKDGYVRDFEKGGGDGMLFDIGADEDEEEVVNEKLSEKTPRCECCPYLREVPSD